MPEKEKKCMLCGKPSTDSICEPCKANVQGEAAEKKIKIDKSVNTDLQIKADKLSKDK